MAGVDVANDTALLERTGQGQPPVNAPSPNDGGEALFAAAFRQTNSVVSALQYARNSGRYTPQPGYNPIDDIKAWKDPTYFLNNGAAFVGSQSPDESLAIKAQIDQETKDKAALAANGGIGFIAQMGAGMLDPTLLLPGGVAIDAAKGGLAFSKAAVNVGKAALLQTTAQEALLQGTQQTRTLSESAMNVASGTMLTALIGGGAAALFSSAERTAVQTKLWQDRGEINTHAENPASPEISPTAANANESAATSYPAAVGAAASDTRKIELVNFGLNQIPGVRTIVEKTSPMQRLFGSESVSARRAAADLAETSLLTKENLEGGVTTAGPALDREARLLIHQGQVQVGDELSRLFSDYRFGEQKSFPRARGVIEDLTGRAESGKMSYDQFKEEITDALRNGDVHENPQVQQAAQFIRNNIFEPYKKRAIEAGLLPEDVDVKTADSYLQRIWNKQAVAAKRPEFVDRVTDWLAAEQQKKAQIKDRLEGLSGQLSTAQKQIDDLTAKLAKTKDEDLFRSQLEEDLIRAHATHERARKQIEKELASWDGKSVAEAKSALKARAKAEEGRAPDAKRLTSADKIVDKTVKRILKSDRALERSELRSRADEITNRILGSPDGRLPYDLGMEHGQGGFGGGEQPRGALAQREFNIPDATIKDFLESDIEHIVATHLRTMVPDVLLTEKFGDTAMTEAFRKINDDYAALTSAAKSEAQRAKLEKERQQVISDLAAVRDRVRGVYGLSAEAPLRNVARVAGVLKNYNVLTSMGSAALSSLPDMAGVVIRHGLSSTFNDAWAPFFKFMTGQSDAFKEAHRQFRAMGIAVESTLASRHHALTDTLDVYHPQSRLERTMQWATNKFQFVNLLAPWTDWAKTSASMVAGSEILRAVSAAAEGKATARQLRNLGESGIEPHMATRISEAFKNGGEVRDGVHLPNTADWADKEARRVFEGAVARDADIAVVTPGQEKPLWMSHGILSVFGQFKSFTAAATERIMISNLQRRDAQVLQGVLFSMGLGMVSYKINSLTGGSPVSDNPGDWVKESISRGNLLGWFEEGNALASKATRGGVDIYRLVGSGKPLTRYASRSAADQLLGPTVGKVQTIIGAVSAASNPAEWNESDSKALRRLVAAQNVFYIRRMFDQVEASGNSAFGIEMKQKLENR